MSNQENGQKNGIVVTIDQNGKCEHTAIGKLNDVELLGIGQYISTLPQISAIEAVLRGQMQLFKVMENMTHVLEQLQEEEGENSCSPDSPSEPSPS